MSEGFIDHQCGIGGLPERQTADASDRSAGPGLG